MVCNRTFIPQCIILEFPCIISDWQPIKILESIRSWVYLGIPTQNCIMRNLKDSFSQCIMLFITYINKDVWKALHTDGCIGFADATDWSCWSWCYFCQLQTGGGCKYSNYWFIISNGLEVFRSPPARLRTSSIKQYLILIAISKSSV